MGNPHPPVFSTGIDATEVDQFIKGVLVPTSKTLAVALVDLAINIAKAKLEKYTPDQVDEAIERFAAELKTAAREALK